MLSANTIDMKIIWPETVAFELSHSETSMLIFHDRAIFCIITEQPSRNSMCMQTYISETTPIIYNCFNKYADL